MKITNLNSEKGFTIVELMIALSVLSVILLMSTVIMIQITALYSKGVNAANLQNSARNIVADVTASLQFSAEPPAPCTPATLTCYAKPLDPSDVQPRTYSAGGINVQVYAFCIGSVRYSYVLDRELGTDTTLTTNAVTPHVMWRDTIKQSSACQPLNLSQSNVPIDTSSTETSGNSKGYEMMGDHMRLSRFKVEQSPAGSGVYTVDVWGAFGDRDLVVTSGSGSATCRDGNGTQFCATTQITTSIVGRVY